LIALSRSHHGFSAPAHASAQLTRQSGWQRFDEHDIAGSTLPEPVESPGPSAKALGKRPARSPSPPSRTATLDTLDEESDSEAASFPPGEEERRVQEARRRHERG